MNLLDELLKGVSLQLKEVFPDIKRYTKQVEQGYSPPAFFITLVPVSNGYTSGSIRERVVTVDIVYISAKDDRTELYKIADEASYYFYSIRTPNGVLVCQNGRQEIVDNTLHIMFDVYLTEVVSRPDNHEVAGEVIIN